MQKISICMHNCTCKFSLHADCVVMKDPKTKRSRGFGFITFKTVAMVSICVDFILANLINLNHFSLILLVTERQLLHLGFGQSS